MCKYWLLRESHQISNLLIIYNLSIYNLLLTAWVNSISLNNNNNKFQVFNYLWLISKENMTINRRPPWLKCRFINGMWMVRKWRKLHLLEYLIYFAILRTLSPVILNQSQLNTIRRVINDILWPYFYIIVLMRKTCEHFFF